MTIDKLRKEMVDFGFNQNQIDNALEIIYFIGIGQDLAWRKSEGIIKNDISINKPLLDYLKQGYILECLSKYGNYGIYILDDGGDEIIKELIEIKGKSNFESFKIDFLNINPIFAILSLPIQRSMDSLKVKNDCEILFLNSKKGDDLKKILNEKKSILENLLIKYNFIIELTHFQSNKKDGFKSKFINNDAVCQLLSERFESFPRAFYDSIIELNKKVSYFNDLINSIEDYKIRDKINTEYSNYYNECKELIDKLKEEKITTSFNSSNPSYFKIIDEQKFKNRIEKLKQEYIDEISNPIIDSLINGSCTRPPVLPPQPSITKQQPPVTPPIVPVTLPQPPITPSHYILVGFECGTGNEVKIKPAHLFISGLTQKSGKTTTLEALIQRSGLSTISFITKPGEKCFDKGEIHKPFFQEKAEWRVVEKLFESQLGEKMKDVRAKLIELCKHEKTLKSIKQSIDNALEDSKGTERKSLILLQAYFEDLFKELENKEYTSSLSLRTGINLMDLSSYNEELQSYIINSVLYEILHNNKNTVIVIPEAWKFIPQSKRTPSKYSIEQLIRQGAVNNNFVWFDSQDIAGVDKSILKSVSIWILGLQTEVNEVEHTIAQIPLPKNQRPTNDQIMNLQIGEFFICFDGKCKKTYVMPNWMSEDEAREIAKSKKTF